MATSCLRKRVPVSNGSDNLWEKKSKQHTRFDLLTEQGEVRPYLTNRQQICPDLQAIAPLTLAEIDPEYQQQHGLHLQHSFVEWVPIATPAIGADFVYVWDRPAAFIIGINFTVQTSAAVVGRSGFVTLKLGGICVAMGIQDTTTMVASTINHHVWQYTHTRADVSSGAVAEKWIRNWFPRSVGMAGMVLQSEMVLFGALQATDQITGVWLQVEYL